MICGYIVGRRRVCFLSARSAITATRRHPSEQGVSLQFMSGTLRQCSSAGGDPSGCHGVGGSITPLALCVLAGIPRFYKAKTLFIK